MKKLALTIAIVLGLTMITYADSLFNYNGNAENGGLFHRGPVFEKYGEHLYPSGMLLPSHGSPLNADADQVPVGSGIAVLAILGGAYLLGKKRK